jgi:2-keto-4-pentenoate hydratase/2-oxohepta-3-ene-1,7-dioic acid hydratase in catechol pathway
MRLVQYVKGSRRRLGVVVGDQVADIAALAEVVVLRERGYRGHRATRLAELSAPVEIADFLALGEASTDLAGAVAAAVESAGADQRGAWTADGVLSDLADLTYAPPFTPDSSFWCIGLNYADHVAEQAGRAVAPYADIFIRLPDTFVGHGEPLLRPTDVSVDLDFEGELAVVIGKPGHRISREDALDHVFGYTLFNDGSLRDFQKRGPGLTPGKNFYHSGALGPWIITADEVPQPQELGYTTTLSGEVMQSANTRDMIFDIRAVIVAVSEFAHLQPGDVISTGTAAGVGFRRTPPRFMQPGETVRIEFDGVGVLENPIVEETDELASR